MTKIERPVLLSSEHETDAFDCGERSLNEWLKKTALQNQVSNASRSYVLCKANTVIGYYCLSSGAICRESGPSAMRRNQPSQVPVVVLGRLAIDKQCQRSGYGRALLRDAMLRIVHASQGIGICAVLIHAISLEAKQFYLSCGFVESPLQEMTLMMTVKTMERILQEASQE